MKTIELYKQLGNGNYSEIIKTVSDLTRPRINSSVKYNNNHALTGLIVNILEDYCIKNIHNIQFVDDLGETYLWREIFPN